MIDHPRAGAWFAVVDNAPADLVAAIARPLAYAVAQLGLPSTSITWMQRAIGESAAEQIWVTDPDALGMAHPGYPGRIFLVPTPAAPFVVLHEARHAWQHRQPLGPAASLVDAFTAFQVAQAQMEVDAKAWGMQAAQQLFTGAEILAMLQGLRATREDGAL